MAKMVKVNFSARAQISIGGEIEIPEEMLARIPEGDNWSLEIERYIAEHYDGHRHVDYSSLDDDLDDFDVIIPESQP